MAMVFPAWRVSESERRIDPETGRLMENNRGGFFVVEPEAEEYIETTLGKQFGVTPFFLMNLTKDPRTWAAVFFTEIIKDSDEVLTARAELRSEIGFAAYGDAKVGMNNPPLGAMAVMSAAALQQASSRHEVFKQAWDALQSCEAGRKWVAVIDL